MDTSNDTLTKRCSKCGKEYPETSEYFTLDNRNVSGLGASCVWCERERSRSKMRRKRADANYVQEENRKLRERYASDPEFRERQQNNQKRFRKKHTKRLSEQQKRRYANDKEYRDARRRIARNYRLKRYHSDDQWKTEQLKKSRNYQRNAWRNNPEFRDRRYTYRAEWLEQNRDMVNAKIRFRHASDPEFRQRRNKRYREWAARNPDINKVRQHRYRARKESLPDTLTADDWNRALEYFHGCCAVCERQMNDLFGERTVAMDHWIPLVQGGPTTPTNIVPLCHGIDGCNNSKRDKDPYEWLMGRYGKRKAKQVIRRIQDYFKTL